MTEETRVKIFLADDDPAVIQMVKDPLIDADYEVATATQSLRVFDRVRETMPDLIILDLIMPYFQGPEQMQLFSLDDDLKVIPVIMIAEAGAFGNESALDVMANLPQLKAWLTKPLKIDLLLEVIKRVLSGEKGIIDGEVFEVPHTPKQKIRHYRESGYK